MHRHSPALCAVLFLLAAMPAAAQEPDVPRGDTIRAFSLSPEIAEELIAFVNHPGTIQFSGRGRIPAERTVTGDVAVLGGPLIVAGRIEGRVVVINGDVELLPGAVITGDLTVAGGEISGTKNAVLGGVTTAYSEPLRYRRSGARIVRIGPAMPGDSEQRAEQDGERVFSRGELLIATGQSYNRVEGLPVVFGPVIETAGSNPLHLRALAIYRSESGLTIDTDRLGYYVRAEQYLGGRKRYRVGAAVHSLIDPIEDWRISDLENGLATFFLRRDYRDHYERRGWSVFAGIEPPGLPLSLAIEARREHHTSLPGGSPWTLFRNAESWRPQPLVAEGELSSVTLGTTFDTRSDAENPAWGWYVRGNVERSFGTELVRPAVRLVSGDGFIPGSEPVSEQRFGNFTAGFLDLRRYNRVSPDSRLNFRLLAGGSLNGSPLPPQRQHALGGAGSLPGYDLFRFDCGARSERVRRADEVEDAPAYFPRYGCDGFALVQAEYRGQLSLRFDWSGNPRDGEPENGEDQSRGWGPGWSMSPDWIVFVDAARAWAFDRPGTEDVAVDLGVGLTLGKVGIFLAVPLNRGSGINVFARLGPRF